MHMDSAVPGVRERGLAAGQCLMNCLHSTPGVQQLKFELGDSSDVMDIFKLARSVHLVLPQYSPSFLDCPLSQASE